MLKGEMIKTTVYMERDLLTLLKIALAMDELTASEWFRRQARIYIQGKKALRLDSI